MYIDRSPVLGHNDLLIPVLNTMYHYRYFTESRAHNKSTFDAYKNDCKQILAKFHENNLDFRINPVPFIQT